jgi:hypothetical protein
MTCKNCESYFPKRLQSGETKFKGRCEFWHKQIARNEDPKQSTNSSFAAVRVTEDFCCIYFKKLE